ncbi:hypothetical protein N7532_008486 [Penicillium argentinense]|uniref:Uncharacterized protein n=1 Tax=Penicillium argentinense TaxID=1131581 RepID=A0A9W9EXH2_9EURO|nr:uncharacterized protein N7532_008486 [Penicillium argentinense]KAJ5089802.1 hypothetical protein N7532_008486 [Penicillium argentinense]
MRSEMLFGNPEAFFAVVVEPDQIGAVKVRVCIAPTVANLASLTPVIRSSIAPRSGKKLPASRGRLFRGSLGLQKATVGTHSPWKWGFAGLRAGVAGRGGKYPKDPKEGAPERFPPNTRGLRINVDDILQESLLAAG